MNLLDLFPSPHKASHSARQRWKRPDYRAKQIEAARRSHSAEHMAKMVEASRSEEARAKRSQSLKLANLDVRLREKKRAAWTKERRIAHAKKIKAAWQDDTYRYRKSTKIVRGAKGRFLGSRRIESEEK